MSRSLVIFVKSCPLFKVASRGVLRRSRALACQHLLSFRTVPFNPRSARYRGIGHSVGRRFCRLRCLVGLGVSVAWLVKIPVHKATSTIRHQRHSIQHLACQAYSANLEYTLHFCLQAPSALSVTYLSVGYV